MLFMSKSDRLRVVLKPSFSILDANGQRVMVRGRTVEFFNGRYETNDDEEIAALLKHPFYSIEFTATENEEEWRRTHPEYFQENINIVDGALSTAMTSQPPLVSAVQKQGLDVATSSNKTRDIDVIIEQKIDEKINPLIEKLGRILAAVDDDNKPKRTFRCPVEGCDFVGKSGMEIGAHKKQAHPELYDNKSD